MKSVLIFNDMTYSTGLFIGLLSAVTAETICKTGYGYPVSCPQLGDPEHYTKCCKYYLEPRCCEERSTQVCSRNRHTKRSGSNYDPSSDWPAVWCPQPGQGDEYTICSFNGSSGIGCFSKWSFIAIFVGVFGSIALIGLIIAITMCILCKTGRCFCVKVRPGKYTCMTRSRHERYQAMLSQARAGQRGTMNASVSQPYNPYVVNYGMSSGGGPPPAGPGGPSPPGTGGPPHPGYPQMSYSQPGYDNKAASPPPSYEDVTYSQPGTH